MLQTVCRRRKGLNYHVSNSKCGAMNKLPDNARLHFKSRSNGKCGAMNELPDNARLHFKSRSNGKCGAMKSL
ncbi:hypothetical protein CBG57_10825 [Prevotella nigrescens]|nr:hypothetical protein CBG57_10825 [Prevotella nigrescens]